MSKEINTIINNNNYSAAKKEMRQKYNTSTKRIKAISRFVQLMLKRYQPNSLLYPVCSAAFDHTELLKVHISTLCSNL